MDFQSSPSNRPHVRRRGFRWGLFWLVFSLVALLLLSAFALKKALQPSDAPLIVDNEPPPPAAEVTPSGPPPNPLTEQPRDRPPPEAVNEFLRQEYGRNSERCDMLAIDHGIDLESAFEVKLCRPQWDYRSATREVVWFYVYRSAKYEGDDLCVFGVVDGLGNPLFQKPSLAGNARSLLDSRYKRFKWIALDRPRLALIAASAGPWKECGEVVDLFAVNDNPSEAAQEWRFSDQSFPEQPATSSQMIGFEDIDGDGWRDLCGFQLVEGRDPVGTFYAYDGIARLFQSVAKPFPREARPLFEERFEQWESGGVLGQEPFLLRANRLTPAFEVPKEETPADAGGVDSAE